MKTSNFANNQRYNLKGISISRYPATRQGFNGPEFPPLFPNAFLLKGYKQGRITWPEYCEIYRTQLLCLNPSEVWHQLHQHAQAFYGDGIRPVEPVLLCYESAKTLDTQPCHRRLVAEWFKETLGVEVLEWEKNESTVSTAST